MYGSHKKRPILPPPNKYQAKTENASAIKGQEINDDDDDCFDGHRNM